MVEVSSDGIWTVNRYAGDGIPDEEPLQPFQFGERLQSAPLGGVDPRDVMELEVARD